MKRQAKLLLLAGGLGIAGVAHAQVGGLTGGAAPAGPSSAPVAFTADKITYEKSGNLVIATGHVRAIQNGQTLYADKVVLDRNTDVATATGHVILRQPSGDTVFADKAVLSQGMKNAVMQGVSARLALNARLIANGARRYNGAIDELSKIVYSACNLCKSDPQAPPLWQIRARSATRDLQHKMIEYRDAEMEFDGFPIFYAPYLTQPDPSVKRQTGLLIPGAGASSRLGFFISVPYYIVLGPASDITLTPIIAAKAGPVLNARYRRDFNNGVLNIAVSGGQDRGRIGDSIFSNGTFDLNQSWRAGFAYNHASNPAYLNDFHILPNASVLTSSLYLEGFAPGAYARIDAETFQGLVASVNQSDLPIVAPYGQYHFLSSQDAIGGRLSIDASVFNVLRKVGTNTQRIALMPGYAVPFSLPDGLVGTARVRLVTAAYQTSRLFQQPNYSTLDGATTARVQPYGAVFMRWPLIRQAGQFGSQIIEPEVQLVTSPNVGVTQNRRIPNEDSLDLEFSDANLFSLSRYPGIDRLAGGTRVDYALHAAWYLPHGALLDGLVGQSYRVHKTNDYLPGSGLTDNVSDIVGRLILAPSPLFNIIYRTRLSHKDLGARMIDATANFGTPKFTLSGGYLYSNTNPYVLYNAPPTLNLNLTPPAAYFTPRHEFTASASTHLGQWSLAGGSEYNLQTGKLDQVSGSAGWQNDCFGVSLVYYQQFTSYNLDQGNTTILVQFTFKTLGNVGFSAL
jgi:LPS-assembly protein